MGTEVALPYSRYHQPLNLISMEGITNEELIRELQKRLGENQKLLEEQNYFLLQLEEVNKKLFEAEKLKTNFLSNIRNEIVNPFTSVAGLSKTLMETESLDLSKARTVGRLIYQESLNLDFQLKNIFMAAAIEAGVAELEPSITGIKMLTEECINYFHHFIQQKKLNVKYSFWTQESTGETFTTDKEKLQCILINLISNAVKYSAAEGEVDVKLQLRNKNLSCSIRNNGEYISASNRQDIYNRFVQLNSGMCKEYEGQGLGLSVVKSLVELMQGNIGFDSSEEGVTEFSFCIPEVTGSPEVISSDNTDDELFFSPECKF